MASQIEESEVVQPMPNTGPVTVQTTQVSDIAGVDLDASHDLGTSNGESQVNTFVDGLEHISLPADDGMGLLRRKIHNIRDLDINSNEKARMIHDLMTESYNSLKPTTLQSSSAKSPPSSPSVVNHSPEAQHVSPSPTSPTLSASIPKNENFLSVTAEDQRPTYVPMVEPDSPVVEARNEDHDTEELEETSLGCEHYMRNVKLQCYTCKKWYTCRFCHDAVEDHPLVRRDTENMLCMLCGHPQPAAQECSQCHQESAQYYCDICKLWDNDGNKSIYHCSDCGICRIGQGLGKDFFHCKTCCVCLPISIEDTHRCIERSTQCDCPICGEYMFTSPETVVVTRCGHSIHHKCLAEHSKTSFRCPICNKTITNMESTFRNLDRTIESQPMPGEFKDTKAIIYCNDCGAKSVVKYHWLGLRCDLCESYNTAQIRLVQGDESGVLEEEGVHDHSRRPSSFTDEATSLAALHLSSSPGSQSTLGVPIPTGSRRFVSYNMTHGRAVSPVVSNYFGLPPDRVSEKSSSLPFFGGHENDAEYGALNFLSKKLRDRYGFLAGEAVLDEAASDIEEEEEGAQSSDSSGSEVEDAEEEVEYMDIFGHT